MQLSTSLTPDQLAGALNDAQNAGRINPDVTLWHQGDEVVLMGGSSMEWGWFMARVYERDPSATFNGYFFDHITGPEFHVKTGGLFL